MAGRSLLALLLFSIVPAPAAETAPEVRFLCFAPSPYTHRHDALRAGLGIFLALRDVIDENRLPLRATFHDGSAMFDQAESARRLVTGARVLVIGGSTWAQGSSYYLRRFFELVDTQSLAGVSVSAWATAGGAHTGGETLIADTLRSAMGMGAQVFSLGQKYMVFTTDERTAPAEGHFTPIDGWYMDQFARATAVVALAGGDPGRAAALSAKLGTSPQYWKVLPKNEAALARFGSMLKRLNAAADPRSDEYRELMKLIQ